MTGVCGGKGVGGELAAQPPILPLLLFLRNRPSFRDCNYRNQIVSNDVEIPHCVRNDSVSHYMGSGKSSGEAAAFSTPHFPRKRPSFRPQGEISSKIRHRYRREESLLMIRHKYRSEKSPQNTSYLTCEVISILFQQTLK